MHIFSFQGLMWFFPFVEELNWLNYFDKLAKPEDRKRIMTFYKNCIKRQAYFKGHKSHFLSKNPFFSLKVDSLYEYFPDCKIIYMVRNPLDVVPSMINMAHQIWHSTINIEADHPLQDLVYEKAKLIYNYPLARLEQAPPDSYVTISYEDLVRQPGRVIQATYQRFGFEITPEFLQVLREEEDKIKSYKSRHVYSLDQFRFTREQIVSDLRHIFERFGFSAGQEKGANRLL